MKRFKSILLFMFIIAMALSPLTAEAASQKTKAMKAYRTMLSKKTFKKDNYNNAIPTKNIKFSVAYIDNDSIPELIITYSNYFITHAAGYGTLCTYRNGKIKKINLTMETDFSYYKKKGIFVDSYFSSGIDYRTYYQLSKGKAGAKLVACNNAASQYFPSGKSYYKSKSAKPGTQISTDTKISRKSFLKSLKKYVGSAKKTTVKFHKNTASTRKKYLK